MKNIKYRLLFLACVLAIIGLVYASETIAVILKATGKVTVIRTGQSAETNVDRGFRMEDGDKLSTGKKSHAALRFIDDASLVRIRPNSVCIFHGERVNNQIMKNIYIEMGTILSNITQQKGKFQVATPTSVASVKGTIIIGDHTDRGGTFWYGLEGEAMVNNEVDSTSLGAGETVHVKSRDAQLEKWKTGSGDTPDFEDTEGEGFDEFELDFENDSGKTKKLKFKVKK
jgi:hypothetical protein